MKLHNSDTFCMAAWIHTYLGPEGKRLPCCTFEQNLFESNIPIEQAWNSPDYKSIRKKMMNGELVSGCERCPINQESTYKDYWNNNYKDLYESVISKTDEDGYFNGLPVTFDYRTSKCNFKCKMCNPIFSSAILKEMSKNGKFDVKWNNYELQMKKREELSGSEVIKLLQTDNIREMYWAGGEPLISDLHWTAIIYAVANGHAKDITVRYSTNLSNIKYKKYNLFELLSNFRHVEFYLSIDATSNIGEWIRTGFDYDKWIKHLNEIKKLKNSEITFMVTNSLPSLMDLHNLNKLSSNFNVPMSIQKCVGSNPLLQVQDYPFDVIHPLLDDVHQKISKQNTRNSQYILNWLENNYNEKENEDKISQYKKFWISEMKYLDEQRPHSDINFPSLVNQYPTIKDFIYET